LRAKHTPAGDIGDFNGDGFADFAAYTDENTLSIYFGGTLPDTVPDLVLEGTTYGYVSRLAGRCDFNSDGCDDIVLAMGNADNVVLALGDSTHDGTWDLYFDWGLPGSEVYVTSAGRSDGDAYEDIAISSDAYTQVYLGGDPPDGIPDVTIAHGGLVAGAGDLNDDGFGDLAVGTAPTRIYFGGAVPDTTTDLIIPTPGPYGQDQSCLARRGF
jgi:hypothetical protein